MSVGATGGPPHRYLSNKHCAGSFFRLQLLTVTMSFLSEWTTSDPYHSVIGVLQIPSDIVSQKRDSSRSIFPSVAAEIFNTFIGVISIAFLLCLWMPHRYLCSTFFVHMQWCPRVRTCSDPMKRIVYYLSKVIRMAGYGFLNIFFAACKSLCDKLRLQTEGKEQLAVVLF